MTRPAIFLLSPACSQQQVPLIGRYSAAHADKRPVCCWKIVSQMLTRPDPLCALWCGTKHCIHTNTHIIAHTQICPHAHEHTHTQTNWVTQTQICPHALAHTHAQAQTHTHTHKYNHSNTNMATCTRTHTYRHTEDCTEMCCPQSPRPRDSWRAKENEGDRQNKKVLNINYVIHLLFIALENKGVNHSGQQSWQTMWFPAANNPDWEDATSLGAGEDVSKQRVTVRDSEWEMRGSEHTL